MAALMSGGLLVGGLAVMAAGPAQGVATAPPAGIKAYATGTELHVNVLQTATSQTVGVNQAHSAATFNSGGLPTPGQASEVNGTIWPNEGPIDRLLPAGSEAYGRGAGLEAGVQDPLPDVTNASQVTQAGIAAAASFPPVTNAPPVIAPRAPTQTGLVERQIGPVNAAPVVSAALLRGRALANWNNDYAMPMLGTPIAYGEGDAAGVQLVSGIVNTDAAVAGNARTTANTKSYTYLVNNGDGTCGVATEIHQTFLPVRVNIPPDADQNNDTIIEILGDWVMRGVATGKRPAFVEYAIGDTNTTLPIINIIRTATDGNVVTFDQLFGEDGQALITPQLDPVFFAVAGEPPRGIEAPGAIPTYNVNNANPPTLTVNQLRVAADALRFGVGSQAAGTDAAGVQAFGLTMGHFEMSIDVPTGGFNCEIPIDKSGPPSVDIGTDATFTIKVPTSADVLLPFPCKLTQIVVRDFVEVERADTPSRPPIMNIVSGTGPPGSTGTVSADRKSITFTGVPDYTPGQPPMTFTVRVTVPPNSGQGRMKNTVTVDAVPGDCQIPDAVFGSLLGGARFFGSSGAGLTGNITGNSSHGVRGSDIVGGIGITRGQVLAVTGRNDTLFLGLALAALATGVGAMRLRRRVTG